jgi:glycosyltransferase involved in cell wall biosynthesis
MKVLMPILHYWPVIGGFEIFIQNIAERLSKSTDIFIVTGKVMHTANKERRGGFRIFRTSFFKLKDLSYSSWFYILTAMPFIFLRSFYMIKREKIPLVHCQGRLSGLIGYFLKKTTKTPYILTVQSADFSVYHPKANIKPIRWIYNFIRKKIYQNAIKCHAVSSHLKDHFGKWGIKDVAVIPNGVDNFEFRPDPDKRKTRKELGFDTDNLIVACGSRLEHKNGTHDVVEAANYLKERIDDFKIVIIGDGPDRSKLEKMIAKFSLEDKVYLLGYILHPELPKYMAAADIFIRPSLAEGFGIIFIEAMAAGAAVVGTPVGGIVDFLKDPSMDSGQATGLFCEPGNPRDIAEKIELLIKDKQLRNRLVENGQKLVAEVYNWDKISEKIKKVYKETLST